MKCCFPVSGWRRQSLEGWKACAGGWCAVSMTLNRGQPGLLTAYIQYIHPVACFTGQTHCTLRIPYARRVYFYMAGGWSQMCRLAPIRTDEGLEGKVPCGTLHLTVTCQAFLQSTRLDTSCLPRYTGSPSVYAVYSMSALLLDG